jgi:hypothetical protein
MMRVRRAACAAYRTSLRMRSNWCTTAGSASDGEYTKKLAASV